MRIAIQIGVAYRALQTTLCQEEGILLQKHRDRIGGISRYFSKVSGSVVDLTLLRSGVAVKGDGRSTKNGYETSKGSKGIYACGTGEQLQAQKEEVIHLTHKRLRRDFFIFLQRDSLSGASCARHPIAL